MADVLIIDDDIDSAGALADIMRAEGHVVRVGYNGCDGLKLARERLPKFKVPRSVDFVDSLPRSAAGKIQRGKVRAKYWQRHSRQI